MQYIFYIGAVLAFSIFAFFIPPELFQSSPFRIIRQIQSLWIEVQFIEFFVALMTISSLINRLCDRRTTSSKKLKEKGEPAMPDLSDPLLPNQETENVVVVPVYTDLHSKQGKDGVAISIIPDHQHNGEEVVCIAPVQEVYDLYNSIHNL